MDPSTRRVLLCMRYGIGDVIMELPVLEALRRALPEAHITALGASPATELLEGTAHVDEVVSLNRWGLRHRWDRGPAGVERAISSWLDEHEFDLFLDVHHVTPVFGEVVRSRGVRSLESDETAERAAVQRGENGVAAIQAAVQAGWGLRVPRWSPPRLTPFPAEREFAAEYFRCHGIGDVAPLAVSSAASLELKRWPLERLARIADEWIEENGARVLAFCGPQESAAEALRGHMRHGAEVICVGPHHLRRVAALLERCRALVCNDTGLMHMAGALGVPTVAVFGPTLSAIYNPPSPRSVSVGGERVGCAYRNTHSLHPPSCFSEGRCLVAERGCIHQTEEEEVRRALERLLKRVDAQAEVTSSVA